MAFNPNARSIQDCVQLVADVLNKHAIDTSKIITSKDKAVLNALSDLQVTNIPGGFNKWQLPIHFTEPVFTFLSFGAPNTDVPEHSHDDGPGLRIILNGSINYDGNELTAGDWMYLPAKAKYSFRVGPMGVGMFYCYCCCCA